MIEIISTLFIICVLAYPLGLFISKVMNGEIHWFKQVESSIYSFCGVGEDEMTSKQYAIAVVSFSLLSLLFVLVVLMTQGYLPLNPNHVGNMSWDLALNTAISYVTNTNYQAYSGEFSVSYLSSMIALTVQNFVSAGVGAAVLFALIRGLSRFEGKTIGNFYVDLTRFTLYVLLPLSVIVAIILVSQGVIASFSENIVVSDRLIPMGPAASQIAIKQLGSNGGGYFGSNSSHPFENPTALSNVVEMISIMLIPVSLVFSFGESIKDKKQGFALFSTMMIVLIFGIVAIMLAENGSMVGREMRFGSTSSNLWTVFTTAVSSGSSNMDMASLTPLGSLVPLLLMMLGEVVFGGIGSGLFGMIGFVMLTVFVAGLMVGRTPEYLGKKVDPIDMKLVLFITLASPLSILITSALAALFPVISTLITLDGAKGFTSFLYTFTSASANNGSSFAGFTLNHPLINVLTGVGMLLARFIPLVAAIYLAGHSATKKNVALTSGTLSTTSPLFIVLLLVVIVLIGALSFFPALALGPIADAIVR